ncbi:MAG: shikimate dehydrogenase, partial [Dietzia sp.]|nr:shikimate dehydrogenase [Dietzia sp.]
MAADRPTFRAAVLGSPVAHSLSPRLHNAGYAALGLDDWHYTYAEVAEGELVDFVQGLDETWRGLSLTMPLKEVAFEVAKEQRGFLREGAGDADSTVAGGTTRAVG